MSQPIPHNGVGVLGLGSGRVPVAERPMPVIIDQVSQFIRNEQRATNKHRMGERPERQFKLGEGRRGLRRYEPDTDGSH